MMYNKRELKSRKEWKNLFNFFSETIFLKSDSDLENKINVLTELQTKYPNNSKISKDLLLAKLGLQGEKEIEYELKNSNLGMYVLHDITLCYNDLTAQIDYIVITKGKIYLVECKNLVGNIIVNERGDFIREVVYNNQKKFKEGIYSPLRQAEIHKEVLKKIFLRKANLLDKIFLKERFDNWYVSLVVTANSKNILNTKYAPKEYKKKVIKSDQLIKYIESDLKQIDSALLSNKRKMEKIANRFLELNQPIVKDYEIIYKQEVLRKQNIKDYNSTRNKLLLFRRKKAKEKHIPEYYIFSNDELDNLIKIMPQNIEILKEILSETKVRLHGKEIIHIIKSGK